MTIRPPAVPIVANVTAAGSERARNDPPPAGGTGHGPRALARKRARRFAELGVDTTVEAGGSKVLTGMVKRIDKDLQTIALDTPADIEAFAKTL